MSDLWPVGLLAATYVVIVLIEKYRDYAWERRAHKRAAKPYQSMRERNGLPDWPPPPKVAPPPSYRDPAPRTVEDRLDALERAEAARALREVGEPSGIAGDDDISAEVRIAIAQQRYRRGLRDEVDEFERAAAGKQPKETR